MSNDANDRDLAPTPRIDMQQAKLRELDIETNGIILPSVVHCVCMINAETGEAFRFADQPGYYSLADFTEVVDDADELREMVRQREATLEIPQESRENDPAL